MNLTGNPFVDTGIMVLTELAELSSSAELSWDDIRRVHGDGSFLARRNQQLKSYTMTFGTNGPLTQPAYRKVGKNEAVYLSTLSKLLDYAENKEGTGPPCDLTGIASTLSFQVVANAALTESGLKAPGQKWVGRDWVPLGGSLGNDAQALPGASRPLHVSAFALFVLQYLPLGVFLFKGKLACYQSTAQVLAQNLTAYLVRSYKNSLDSEIIGKGGGTAVMLTFLLNHFELLQEHKVEHELSSNTELLLWLFSNAGTGADCARESVPETALRFASDAVEHSFGSQLRQLLKGDPKDSRIQLFECIRACKDYSGLYPFKKAPGCSPEFYAFYQQRVCCVSISALAIASQVAREILSSATPKEVKEIQKPDFVKSTGRNRIRKYMAENLTLAEYDTLFPSSHHPIKSAPHGWNLLRFYLLQSQPVTFPPHEANQMTTTHPKIVQVGDAYFATLGPKKIKVKLDQLARRELGVSWLQDIFCRLAQKYPDFDLGSWDDFVCDDQGKPVTFELLFQLRLYLSNKYRQSLVTPASKNSTTEN